MGRTRYEGQKNLVKMLDNQRYVRVFFTKGSRQMPSMTVSASAYEKLAAGFAKLGYFAAKTESEQ